MLTGGDPLKRQDVFELVDYAATGGLQTAMTPSATPLLTGHAIRRLKDSGLHRLAVSLDGALASTHDGFRRVPGSYERTLMAIEDAYACGLPAQINTTIGRHNLHELDEMFDLVGKMKVALWSVFFIVPTGRATADLRLSAQECEDVFARLFAFSRSGRMPIKTTEAPHYRRFVLQQQKLLRHGRPQADAPARPVPPGHVGTNDGKGVMFVSHTGEIFPSGFLPIAAGRFPADSLVDVYQNSAMFRQLRNADLLSGKCGQCEYRFICGGSRARAYAVDGDSMASEPDCIYQPQGAVACAPEAASTVSPCLSESR